MASSLMTPPPSPPRQKFKLLSSLQTLADDCVLLFSGREEVMMEGQTKLLARERELHNGRLAMVGVACLSLQSILAGEDSLARLLGLF